MAKHGVYTNSVNTSSNTPVEAESGIPFVIGIAPLASVDADNRATPNVPFLARSYAEATEHLGYSENWEDYTLCEFMVSFTSFLFLNLLICGVLFTFVFEVV